MHQDHDLLVLKVPILPIPTLSKLNKLESNIGARRHVAGVMNGDIEDGLSWPSYTCSLSKPYSNSRNLVAICGLIAVENDPLWGTTLRAVTRDPGCGEFSAENFTPPPRVT